MLPLQLSEVNNYQPSMMVSDVYMQRLDALLLLCKVDIYHLKQNYVFIILPIDLAINLLSKQ
jgi:predicted Zn-dependent protease